MYYKNHKTSEEELEIGATYSQHQGVNFPEVTAFIKDIQNGKVRCQSGTLQGSDFYTVISAHAFATIYPYKVG